MAKRIVVGEQVTLGDRRGMVTKVVPFGPAGKITVTVTWEGGETTTVVLTNYIVVAYNVTNKTGSMQFNSWGIVLQTPSGQQLEDGLHPMVKARFCDEFPSYCPGGSTVVKDALGSKGDLLPSARSSASIGRSTFASTARISRRSSSSPSSCAIARVK